MKVAALCAGYGGLEMGLELAGIDVDLRWVCEIDGPARRVLAHHHPETPNYGDLRQLIECDGSVQFDWITQQADPEPVDLITAGFPCQDISLAGKQKGLAGAKSGLWWAIADLIGQVRPHYVVLENVAQITRNGGTEVIGSLTEIGYDTRWVTIRASDVGAPHIRARWFCVATNADSPRLERRSQRVPELTGPESGSPNFADPDQFGRNVRPGPSTSQTARLGRDGPCDDSRTAPPDAERQPFQRSRSVQPDMCHPDRRHSERFGAYASAVHRWERTLGRTAPEPTVAGRLNPRFSEWMMGLPAEWVTGPVDGAIGQLHCIGNGVVPQQAAHAIRLLTKPKES